MTEIIPRKKVRINITRLRPSRARWRLIPKAGIQLSFISINHDLSEGKEFNIYITIIIRSIHKAVREIIRGHSAFFFPAIRERKAPANNITIRYISIIC
jgi:hypothetical protein